VTRTTAFALRFFALALLALALAGCARTRDSRAQARSGARVVSATEARGMMMELQDFFLIDVRTQGEFRARRIEGARLIPYNEIRARAGELPADRSAAIFVYCQSGRRSAAAARALVALGFENVYDFGGIIDWRYETVGD